LHKKCNRIGRNCKKKSNKIGRNHRKGAIELGDIAEKDVILFFFVTKDVIHLSNCIELYIKL
jgi:hypothetical protein